MEHRILGHEELADRWHEIKSWVNESLVHGTGDVTAHGLFLECLSNVSQCWILEDNDKHELQGVAITRILHYATYSECVIVATTCNEWFKIGPKILEDIEGFAKEMNCKYTSVYGRRGWSRVLKPMGYKEPYITLMKEL